MCWPCCPKTNVHAYTPPNTPPNPSPIVSDLDGQEDATPSLSKMKMLTHYDTIQKADSIKDKDITKIS